jgi:hypothetical protein
VSRRTIVHPSARCASNDPGAPPRVAERRLSISRNRGAVGRSAAPGWDRTAQSNTAVGSISTRNLELAEPRRRSTYLPGESLQKRILLGLFHWHESVPPASLGVGPTIALTGRGEWMRASGPVQRGVGQLLTRAHRSLLHSTTWSARSSSDGGMVRPSALAVLTLMTSSNFTGAWTGSSLGIAPLRMRSA